MHVGVVQLLWYPGELSVQLLLVFHQHIKVVLQLFDVLELLIPIESERFDRLLGIKLLLALRLLPWRTIVIRIGIL